MTELPKRVFIIADLVLNMNHKATCWYLSDKYTKILLKNALRGLNNFFGIEVKEFHLLALDAVVYALYLPVCYLSHFSRKFSFVCIMLQQSPLWVTNDLKIKVKLEKKIPIKRKCLVITIMFTRGNPTLGR